MHGHATFEKVAHLVAEEMAEWVYTEHETKSGKTRKHLERSVRLIPRRTWRGKISAGGDGRPMKVMQLVL
jgi:diacylglycerol kinase family enzyme